MSSLTEASTSNALRPNLDNSLTSRIPMRFALQYSIASHNTGRSSFFFAPEMCSSKTLKTSIPLYFAYSDKSLTCLSVLCLLTSSTCHPKFVGKERCNALMTFHEHCFADCLLVLRKVYLYCYDCLCERQHFVDAHPDL